MSVLTAAQEKAFADAGFDSSVVESIEDVNFLLEEHYLNDEFFTDFSNPMNAWPVEFTEADIDCCVAFDFYPDEH